MFCQYFDVYMYAKKDLGLKILTREGEQPIKPSGQHRAWLSLLTSQTGEEAQWNSNDQGVFRVRQGTPRFYLLLLLLLLGPRVA
jgi:hypothetical protein